MATKWRIVDCSKLEGDIFSERGAIRVAPHSGPSTVIPTADVSIILVGPSVNFSAAAVHRALSDDVSIIFCDWKGVPEGAAYGWSDHGRVCHRQRAQAELTTPRKKNAWARIIKAKVEGQALTLELRGKCEGARLRSLAKAIRSGDPENIEAQAARIYWQAMWPEEDFRRAPGRRIRFIRSTRNAQLDYAYTVLRGHGIRAVLAAGLAPTIALFHHGRGNNFALVDDLIEPFRPAVDFEVARLKDDADMKDSDVRRHLVAAASRACTSDGLTIPTVLEDLAQHYGQYCEGALKVLPVPTWEFVPR